MKLVISKYQSGPVAGPALSAIRASVDLWSADMAGFAAVFDRIGRQLDAAISEPNLDSYFTANSTQIVVAISDVKWRNTTLFTAYDENDVDLVTARARSALGASISTCESAGFPTTPVDCITTVWSEWARLARKRMRTGAAVFDASPDLQVGTLFASFPRIRRNLGEIASKGAAVPVLAVGLNSPGAGSNCRKWKLRAVAVPLPRWALASGPVAGNA